LGEKKHQKFGWDGTSGLKKSQEEQQRENLRINPCSRRGGAKCNTSNERLIISKTVQTPERDSSTKGGYVRKKKVGGGELGISKKKV